MTEVIAGRIDMFPAPALNAINLTKEGKVSSLAVSSPKRLGLMPDVATLAEIGSARRRNINSGSAPLRRPRRRSRSSSGSTARLSRPCTSRRLADKIIALGGNPMPMTPAEFDAFVRKEIALNAEIVKASGYEPQ